MSAESRWTAAEAEEDRGPPEQTWNCPGNASSRFVAGKRHFGHNNSGTRSVQPLFWQELAYICGSSGSAAGIMGRFRFRNRKYQYTGAKIAKNASGRIM